MAVEDPFFVVRDEVLNAVETANALYHRWQELVSENARVNKEDFNWTTNELRNCLRSIEWDLEDLEETVLIVEKKPKHFKIDGAELSNRREFINRTRASVKVMQAHLRNSSISSKSRENGSLNAAPVLDHCNEGDGPTKPQDRYTRLVDEVDGVEERLIDNGQVMITASPDDQTEVSLTTTLQPAAQIGADDSEQSIRMLDDAVRVTDAVSSRCIRTICRRVIKTLHLDRTSWKQWLLIAVLIVIIVIIVILLCTV